MLSEGVVVARIGKPHALTGEVSVELRTDDPARRFVPGQSFTTESSAPDVPPRLTLASVRQHQAIWLLGFDEIADRTAAETLRGTLLHLEVDTEQSDTKDANTGHADNEYADDGWYEHELVGLPVQDPSGTLLGEVTGLRIGAAQDLLEIRLTDGRDGLVPLVAAMVPEVVTHAQADPPTSQPRVVVDAPPGLFDLDTN